MLESTDKLWRYMKLSTFLLLLDGKAWLPSIATLQSMDPLEGRLGADYPEKMWDELERQGHSQATGKWLRESLTPSERKICGLDLGNYQFISRDMAIAYNRHMTHRRAAWCWFKSNLESAAMWSIYGKSGIGIRTSLEQLTASFPKDKEKVIENMIYVDRRPCAENSLNNIIRKCPEALLRPYFLKAAEYQYEEEVRLIAHCPQGVDGILVRIKVENLINEVVISPLLPLSESEALKKFLAVKFPNLKDRIKQSDLNGRNDTDITYRVNERMYDTSDVNMDLADLPHPLRSL